MPSLGRLLQRLKASFHALCGWVLFRAGCRLRARKHFEQVLLLRGCDFGAYVHLGRIAFAIGDYAGWRREFEHARRTDPAKFARLRHPFELFEPRLAGTSYEDASFGDDGFHGAGERATWRSLLFGPAGRRAAGSRSEAGGDSEKGPQPGAPSSLDAGLDALLTGGAPKAGSKSADGRGGTQNGGSQKMPDGSPRGDDCSTPTERRRFLELGPIRPREVGECDLDDLSRRLSG